MPNEIRLIAAAPETAKQRDDLLAALKEIARIGAIPDQDVEHRRIKRDQMWNVARAAIAAATGAA